MGSGTIATNATVPPLNPPDVDFTEACSLPRPSGSTYCPKASATANDNSIHVTGWFDSSALSGSTKTLTNGTGSGSSSSCDGSDDKKRICLDAGYTYYFKNIDLKNTTTLAIRGTSLFKTIIYLDCESSCSRVFKMAGQTSFAATARPADTLLYMGSSTLNLPEACSSGLPSVQITWGGTLMADLYAPGYDLQLTGNGGIFGRVYATNVSFGGTTAFHYDESLGGIGASGSATAPRQRVILVE